MRVVIMAMIPQGFVYKRIELHNKDVTFKRNMYVLANYMKDWSLFKLFLQNL